MHILGGIQKARDTMGTPSTPEAVEDALNDLGGSVVRAYVSNNFHKDSTILDVGAGWGKYRKLLPDYPMDACEIWEPYVKEEELKKLYDKVFVKDICDLKFKWYDIIIMGDVLEHIEEEHAVRLIKYMYSRCKQIVAVIPYMYPQGEVDHNPYEIHHQDKLTDSRITELYNLRLLAGDDVKGVYIK